MNLVVVGKFDGSSDCPVVKFLPRHKPVEPDTDGRAIEWSQPIHRPAGGHTQLLSWTILHEPRAKSRYTPSDGNSIIPQNEHRRHKRSVGFDVCRCIVRGAGFRIGNIR